MSQDVTDTSMATEPVMAPPPFPAPPPIAPERRLTPGQWGMIAFLCSEVAVFTTLIVVYIVFYGQDSKPGGMGGPTPADVLAVPLAIGTTLCLIASSITIHRAERALHTGGSFLGLWSATIALGVVFLLGTAHEWDDLINRHHLTISRNQFGTTYYTLVGLHALHVTVSVIVMAVVLALAWGRALPVGRRPESVQLVSWYWHFVDGVWIIVFTLVYLMPHLA